MSRSISIASLALIAWLVPHCVAADKPNDSGAAQDRLALQERREAFNQWLADDGALQKQWYEIFEKSLKLKEGPEQDETRAQLDRIAEARRQLRKERAAAAGLQGDEAVVAAPAHDGKPLAELPGLPGAAVTFSCNGTRLLIAGGFEARVWDAKSFQPLSDPMKHETGIVAAALSPDGERLILIGGKRIAAWEVGRATPDWSIEQDAAVLCVAFSPDGSGVATGGEDGFARVWNAQTGQAISDVTPMQHAGPVHYIVFTPAGDRIIASDHFLEPHFTPGEIPKRPTRKERVYVWDAASGKAIEEPIKSRGGPLEGAALSADGERLALNEYWQAGLLDFQTGKRLVTLKDPDSGQIKLIELSADGRRAAVAAARGYVRAWDIETSQPAGPAIGADTNDQVSAFKFSPDGNRLVIAARTGMLIIDSPLTGVWDIATGRKVLNIPAVEAVACDFSPDGRRVAVGIDAGARSVTTIWDVPQGEPPPEKPRRLIAGRIPPIGDKDRLMLDGPDGGPGVDIFGLFERSGLPQDLPLPAETPFDEEPAERIDYHRGYRLGFIASLIDSAPFELEMKGSAAFVKGMQDGATEAYKLDTLREKTERKRRWSYHDGPGRHVVTDISPDDERRVLASFRTFATRFEKALRELYPPTVEIEVVGALFLYSHEFDDYSHDNTRRPQRRREYVGVFDSKEPGNLDWMRVRIKDAAHPGPNDEEVQGRYTFTFSYDEAIGRWALRVNPDFPEGTSHHSQQMDEAGRVWKRRDSKLTRRWIEQAAEKAQSNTP